jgi:dihydropteroate synthase
MVNHISKLLSQKKRTLVVGTLNITPDSFYDGGLYLADDPRRLG